MPTRIRASVTPHARSPKHPVHGSKDASRTPTTAKDASAAQLRISTRPAGRGDANARLGPKRPPGNAFAKPSGFLEPRIDAETPTENTATGTRRGPVINGEP